MGVFPVKKKGHTTKQSDLFSLRTESSSCWMHLSNMHILKFLIDSEFRVFHICKVKPVDYILSHSSSRAHTQAFLK